MVAQIGIPTAAARLVDIEDQIGALTVSGRCAEDFVEKAIENRGGAEGWPEARKRCEAAVDADADVAKMLMALIEDCRNPQRGEPMSANFHVLLSDRDAFRYVDTEVAIRNLSSTDRLVQKIELRLMQHDATLLDLAALAAEHATEHYPGDFDGPTRAERAELQRKRDKLEKQVTSLRARCEAWTRTDLEERAASKGRRQYWIASPARWRAAEAAARDAAEEAWREDMRKRGHTEFDDIRYVHPGQREQIAAARAAAPWPNLSIAISEPPLVARLMQAERLTRAHEQRAKAAKHDGRGRVVGHIADYGVAR